MTPAPFLTLENVTFRLQERLVFQDTHWQFLDNQHWAVIGGNGAGKSTFVRALCGQVPAVSGRIRYHFWTDGRHELGKRAQDRIAYVTFGDQYAVLQRNSPYYQARWNAGVGEDRITVGEYLSERTVQHLNPFQVAEKALDPCAFAGQRAQIVDLLGISGLLAKELIQLSDGERRKISIARALLQRPQLLILDNPLTGLDAGFKQRLTQVIERLLCGEIDASPRVMVVTVRQDEIPLGLTHVLRVKKCRVVAQGPRDQLLQRETQPVAEHPISPEPVLRLPTNGQRTQEARPSVLVQMSQINVSYNGLKVLDGVNWTVRRGEHWALLGTNGAGKTTLLSLILGDHPQVYANDVRLFGRRRGSGESIWEIKQRIGWVAPELHLHYPRTATAMQVVCSGYHDSVGLYQRCTARQQQHAQAWMAHLGITHLKDAPFARLSEGEQRLALLARALVKGPDLLVLDEPNQGLDAANRARVQRTIEAVGRELDASVIYVTHNPDELPRITTHVLWLAQGRVVDNRPWQADVDATRSTGPA